MSDGAVLVESTATTDLPTDAPPPAAAAAPLEPATIAGADPARQDALAAIEQAAGLPPAMRQRLTTLVSQSPQGESVALSGILTAVEQSLPDYLRTQSVPTQPPHPAGEAFFSGAAGELTDSEAETLAQQQLQRAGLLRGQRVRVAD
jgi:hypothetical protein